MKRSVGVAPGGSRQPPPPPPNGGDEEKSRRRWGMTERVLAVLAAFVSLVAAALGVWGAQVADDRDRLSGEVADAHARIEELEATTSTSSTTSSSTTTTERPTTTTTGVDADAVYLNELEPVSGSVDTEETELGGHRYQNVVRQELRVCGTPDTVEFNLGQDYSRFSALAGLHDTVEDPADIWRFVVTTIDGQGEHVVFEKEVPFAQPATIDVSVAGAQRLRLEVVEVEIGWTGSNCVVDDSPATWADPKLIP